MNKLDLYLKNLNHEFPIIAFSETWLKNHNCDRYGLDDYNAEHNCRPNRGGGGVSLYVKDTIEYTVRDDLCFQNDILETLFIEIGKDQFAKKQNIIIGVIYRPPDTDIKQFNDHILQCLAQIKTEKKIAFLLGDNNINLLNTDKHVASQDFADVMFSHSLFPTITKPTRVTDKSATLIDNIFYNNYVENTSSLTGILYTDISDHFPVFHIDYSVSEPLVSKSFKKRIYSMENMEHFSSKMREMNWTCVLQNNDVQNAYNMFYNEFSDVYNTCFPMKTFKQGYRTRKPWLSEGMKKSIKTKNKLYKQYKKTGSIEHESVYKQYRNNLNKLLTAAERSHYETLFNETKDNLKKSWRILKQVINKKKDTSSCSKFLVNQETTTDKNKIAKGFNQYFINIGPTLANKIPQDNKCPTTYMDNRVLESMVIAPVVEEEVRSIIKSLNDSSAGWDAISSRVVKATYSCFLTPLTHVVNISLLNGVFPSELKIARVIPLFKSGEPRNFSNYRPVSVLPLFSKILERLMYTRLLSFITKNNILYVFQFGFRKFHSPNLALIILVDRISKALENGDFVRGLFLDFSKAFDTVNHSILYKKLEFYGVRGLALKWFQSYLSEREQYVEYNNVYSDKDRIICGVPQGSILGPLLFLLYINDLCNVSKKLFSLLFADDSNMFLSGKDPDDLIRTMNEEMVKVIDWLQINRLSLNLNKTHFILFRRKRVRISLSTDLIINNVKIDMIERTKFLGVIIDQNLSFQSHINYIKGKVARGIGILYKSKPYFSFEIMRVLYNAFIYPYFTYCIEVWGNTYQSYLEPLIKLQKRAVRTIVGARKYAHTAPLFRELKLLNIKEIYIYCVQLFMYKYHHSILPLIFSDFYVRNNSIHEHHTRQQNLLHVPLIFTKPLSKTIRVSGVTLYNHFSNSLCLKVSYVTYKGILKRHIIDDDIINLVWTQWVIFYALILIS